MASATVRELSRGRTEGGFDRFGQSDAGVERGLALTAPLYERWFRVMSTGVENIPPAGPTLLTANHSGTLPFDAAMLWADIVRNSRPRRVPRPVLDTFVSALPFFNVLFARAGCVGGSRANVEVALESGELLLVFPEGVPGISKPFSERYQLQGWRVGHAELAIRHGASVVPAAVIGAEEQMPQWGRLAGLRLFGAPYLPLVLNPFPLPVRYHLYYGEPIPLGTRHAAAEADDPAIVSRAAEEVREAVAALIKRGLQERKGVFA